MFITYEKIYSRSIKNIEESEMQPQDCDIISLDCVIRRECVTVTLRNILYMFDISVNLLSIDKLLNFLTRLDRGLVGLNLALAYSMLVAYYFWIW